MKIILLSAIVLFSVSNCFSQRLNDKYYFLPADTVLIDHFLTFKNDSVVQISSVPRHMWKYFEKDLKYEKQGTLVLIFVDDSLQLINYGFKDIKELKIEGNALTNEFRREVYVLRKDFDKSPDLILKFDSKDYNIDMGRSNSYGLVTKSPKTNKQLQRKLKTVDLNDYEINLIKGYDAFKKYGYKYVFGVIELKMK